MYRYQREAEGRTLHLSPNTDTGYLGVFVFGERYSAYRCNAQRHLGFFNTAVEAAVAVAKATKEVAAIPVPPTQASVPIGGSIEAALDASATNLPPNHKLFTCRVSRPEMGKKGSLISAYIQAFNSRFKFSVPCERDFMMR